MVERPTILSLRPNTYSLFVLFLECPGCTEEPEKLHIDLKLVIVISILTDLNVSTERVIQCDYKLCFL